MAARAWLVAFAVMLLAAASGYADPLRLVVLGDMPYAMNRQTETRYAGLLERINAAQPDLVIHVGDTKSGGSPCSDAALSRWLGDMARLDTAVLYTPGDNEWTDCHRKNAGGFDPLERLQFLRHSYFDGRRQSFGRRPLPVTTQANAGYPENVRLRLGDTLVITTHVVGSNNNLRYTPASDHEFLAREAATLSWLRESFAAAKDTEQVVVAMQANMFFAGFLPGVERIVGRTGHTRVLNRLVDEARAYGKPVLLVYGDTHRFRVGQPFPRRAPNVTALEVPGAGDIRALQITLATPGQARYRIEPLLPDVASFTRAPQAR